MTRNAQGKTTALRLADETVASPYRDPAAASSAGRAFATEESMSGLPLFRADRMLESLRYAEYDLEHAIGELVDNSVESGARHVWVRHTREPMAIGSGKKTASVVSTVAVIDDGEGMNAEVLGRALVLGDSPRPRRGKSLGIGRFGVGMTLGALSLGRRIEVYSRDKKTGEFLFTYLDLDAVNEKRQTDIPLPTEQAPPAEYAELLKASSGTVVILSRCDRLQRSQVNDTKPLLADEIVAGLANWLGRTYRKFITNGVELELDGQKLFLHDPLYAAGPTFWDAKAQSTGQDADPKAKVFPTEYIAVDVPGRPGEQARVAITMSLLPEAFRHERFAGNRGIAKERRITENEGISILRADREVLYGRVPYLTDKAGVRGSIEIDRFWGCEISFPPELDPYFEVRYIKRGAEPVPALKKQLKDLIAPYIKTFREQISSHFDVIAAEQESHKQAYTAAEDALAAARLPRTKRGEDVDETTVAKTVDQIVDESNVVKTAPPEERPQRKREERKRVSERPYSIVPVAFPGTVLFQTVFLPGKVVVKLNTQHPFYSKVFEPICGSVEELTEDSTDATLGAKTPAQRRARDGFMLLLLSFARAEAMYGSDPFEGQRPDEVFGTLTAQWGIALAAAVKQLPEYE